MNSHSNSTPSTEEIRNQFSEEEEKHLERLSKPTYRSAHVSDKKGAALLEAVFGK